MQGCFFIMKIGDLVYYKTPIGLPNNSPLGIVTDMSEELGVAEVTWVSNNKADPMPIKWLEVISPLRSEI